MSPSLLAAQRVWFLSVPAFAIFLTFFWYRKKRGSLKTDSGGAVEETRNDQVNIECEESKNPPDNILSISEEELYPSGDKNQFEVEVIEIIDHIEVDTKLESISDTCLSDSVEPLIEEVSVPAGEIDSEPKPIEVGSKKVEKVKKNKRDKKSRKMAKKSSEKRQKEDNTACILEKKLAELDLSASKCNGDAMEKKPLNEDVAERDSANNSPSEVMLACPSVSGYSDTHSEGSSDSGKGCSEMLTPSRTPASGNSVSGDHPATMVYEFEIPQYLVGRLIGRYGCNENEIKKATNATIYIKTHPNSDKLKICAVEGKSLESIHREVMRVQCISETEFTQPAPNASTFGIQMDVDSALEMIRHKFPKKRFPDLTLEQVVMLPKPLMIPIFLENYQLYLIEGINNDVILSSLVSAGHFFLQQPTHPTFPALTRLDSCMSICYSQPNQPRIPDGVGAGVLCAAPAHDGWYRAQIMEMEKGKEYCIVKFLDYGGFLSLPVSFLRQIRADFINLPFQAAECFLADVIPANGESAWSEEAKEIVENLTFGNILQAQVYGYTVTGAPLIYLYTSVNHEFILINEVLVERGCAEWKYSKPVTEAVQEDIGASPCSKIEEDDFVAVPV